MFSQAISFWTSIISRCVSWLFSIQINTNPNITLGMFLLGCAFIGVVLYFILGSDFFPGHINVGGSSKSASNDNYVPRHAPGNAGKDFSTRESRHKY